MGSEMVAMIAIEVAGPSIPGPIIVTLDMVAGRATGHATVLPRQEPHDHCVPPGPRPELDPRDLDIDPRSCPVPKKPGKPSFTPHPGAAGAKEVRHYVADVCMRRSAAPGPPFCTIIV
jgi:hypothetical protein